jgi:hypothetical protein
MGLDMYMTARRYVWGSEEELQTKIKEVVEPFRAEWEPKEVSFRVGYWRKANAIHNWFVQNVQDGEDDCKEYGVYEESIKDLYQVVCEVLEAHTNEVALEKLSPAAGFFFGSTEINEWYWQDLENTKKILQPLVDAFNEADKMGDKRYTHPIYKYDFYYQSSW